MKGKKGTLIQQLIMVVSIGVMAATMTLGWFYDNKRGDVSDLQILSIEATGFRISADGIDYKISETIPIPDNVKMRPVSGNGTDFYLPLITSGSNTVDSSATWVPLTYDKDAEENYYYKQTLYFRAVAPGYIKLQSLTLTPAASGTELFSANKNDVLRRVENSLYREYDFSNGYLSKDYIAAAARVYFKTSQATNDLMYLPLDDVSVTLTDNGNGKDLITVNENAVPVTIENSVFYDGNYENYYTSLSGVNFYRDSETSSALTITELTADTQSGSGTETVYESSIDVYIWIEGYDNEALDCLSGGRFNISMVFTFEKKVSN